LIAWGFAGLSMLKPRRNNRDEENDEATAKATARRRGKSLGGREFVGSKIGNQLERCPVFGDDRPIPMRRRR
jgi:hypothetical protein